VHLEKVLEFFDAILGEDLDGILADAKNPDDAVLGLHTDRLRCRAHGAVVGSRGLTRSAVAAIFRPHAGFIGLPGQDTPQEGRDITLSVLRLASDRLWG
jgi:hypothetical protein